eukprot:g4185.t1
MTMFWTVGARSGCTKDDNSYDYFLLVQQWPATQSSGSWPEGANTSDFLLHGLWPSRVGSESASYPCECTEESFDQSKVSDLLSRMETNWASYTGQNQQFWSHEWSKHGTCSIPFLGTQHDYFSNALDARVQTALLTMLSRSNIVPDSTKTYTSADISNAVGHAPALGCKGSKLSEIAVCLSKDDLSRQDCDPSVLSNRGEFNDCPETGIVIPSSSSPSPSPSGKCADYGCGGVYDPTRPCQYRSSHKRAAVPGINTTQDVIDAFRDGKAASICRHIIIGEEVADYAYIKKDKDEFVKMMNDEIDWEKEENFVSNERWKEMEEALMEFLHFMESAHGNVLPKEFNERSSTSQKDKRRYVFEALNRTWQQEIEMIGNSVMGTTKVTCSEVLSELMGSTKISRKLRIALAMELLYD